MRVRIKFRGLESPAELKAFFPTAAMAASMFICGAMAAGPRMETVAKAATDDLDNETQTLETAKADQAIRNRAKFEAFIDGAVKRARRFPYVLSRR